MCKLILKDGTSVPFRKENSIPENFSGEVQGYPGDFIGNTCAEARIISERTKRMVWFKHNDVLIRVKVGSKKMSS